MKKQLTKEAEALNNIAKNTGQEPLISEKKPPSTLRYASVVPLLSKITDIADIEKMLNERPTITNWWYILHDKDKYTDEEQAQNPLHIEGELKKPHYHILMDFKNPTSFETIAKWFNPHMQDGHYPTNLVQNKTKTLTANILYLIHYKRPEKHQYNPLEITSKNTLDIQALINNIGKKKLSLKRQKQEEIVSLIDNETIKEYNVKDHLTPQERHDHCDTIRKAFNNKSDDLSSDRSKKNMNVIYIHGTTGTGKTVMSNDLAFKQAGKDFHVSGSSNDLMDGYKGQKVIILDDLKPSSINLPDLLKLLDNNTNSLIKSRYKNKHLVHCKTIIITSSLSIERFFEQLEESGNEDIAQLKRRCKTYIRLETTTMDQYKYIKTKRDYQHIGTFKNPVIQLIVDLENEPDEDDEYFNSAYSLEPISQPVENDNIYHYNPLAATS
jgi:hypothetical protein